MITIATTPTTQPAMTPTTLEEKSPLSVCVLLLLPDGPTVDDVIIVVIDIDKESIVDGFIAAVVLIYEAVPVVMDDCTIAVADTDEVIEKLGVLVGNFIVPVIGMPENKVHGSS